MTTEEEKPDLCKFCGSKDVLIYESEPYDWHIKCVGKCGMRISGYATRDQALAAWNRKPEPLPITRDSLKENGFSLGGGDMFFKSPKGKIVVSFWAEGINAIFFKYKKEREIYISGEDKLTLAQLMTLRQIIVD